MHFREGRLSHYRVGRLLGEGGMGQVYLAEDLKLGRSVALKVLGPEMASDPAGLRRFLREARTAASLSHPNVVAVYEVGEEQGVSFIAMEYVAGSTLRHKISAGPLDISQAISIARQIANALVAAHSAGIVHRDIKPENVLLTDDRHVKVLDFGLATEPGDLTQGGDMQTRTQITVQGQIVGTLTYMSPEQLRGQPADARSDVFALGIVLYEMLAGRRPFEGASQIDYLQRVINDVPDPLARFNYAVPEPLERIVRKCLEKDPEWRYQSVRELSIDLASLERNPSDSSVRSAIRTVSQIGAPRKAPSRRYLWFGAGALLLCAAAAGIWFLRAHSRLSSVAVLPIVNASGDSGLDYIAEGIAESLQRDLAGWPSLHVASRSQSRRYTGQADPSAVGRDLRVGSIIAGRLTHADRDIRLAIELVDTSTGAQIWSREYERSPNELLDLEDSVLSDLGPRLNPRASAGKPAPEHRTSDAQAYDLFLRGRFSLNRRTPADLQAAIALFRDSVNRDPGYSLAHSGLADAYTLMANFGIQPPVTILPQAKSEARRALELDPELAEAHTSYALALAANDFDWKASEASFRRAIKLNPHYAQAHAWFAIQLLTPLKRYEEALIEIRRAIELEPNEPIYQHTLAVILYYSRRAKEAIARLHEMNPAYLAAARRAEEALCLNALGKPSQALAVLADSNAPGDQTGQFNRTVLAYSYAAAGRRREAEKIAADLDAEARNVYSSACGRGAIQVGLGNRDRALALLRECYENRDLDFRFSSVDARFDALRPDFRFVELLAKAGLR